MRFRARSSRRRPTFVRRRSRAVARRRRRIVAPRRGYRM